MTPSKAHSSAVSFFAYLALNGALYYALPDKGRLRKGVGMASLIQCARPWTEEALGQWFSERHIEWLNGISTCLLISTAAYFDKVSLKKTAMVLTTAIGAQLVIHHYTTSSPPIKPLAFSEEEIKKVWEPMNPCRGNYHCYKKESPEVLVKRRDEGYSNFPNIGGNPDTRLTIQAPESEEIVFLEANQIEEDKIATGYPTKGIMRSSYWHCIEKLSEKRSVIIVNLMAKKDERSYGGLFLLGFTHNIRCGLSTPSICTWEGEIKCLENLSHVSWNHKKLTVNKKNITAYSYPTWEDFGDSDIEVVAEIIKALHLEMETKENPIVVCNCRAGVGRTGTFLTALHYYQMIQRKDLDPKKYTLESIRSTIIKFRQARGEVQFVQTSKQFHMLCELIQKFYNEALDARQ